MLIAARMAMTTITIKSSTIVKPARDAAGCFFLFKRERERERACFL